MEMLNNEEMLRVQGGGFKASLFFGILGGALVFAMGIIEGIVNPKKCN